MPHLHSKIRGFPIEAKYLLRNKINISHFLNFFDHSIIFIGWEGCVIMRQFKMNFKMGFAIRISQFRLQTKSILQGFCFVNNIKVHGC